jgi:hypothetical protein
MCEKGTCFSHHTYRLAVRCLMEAGDTIYCPELGDVMHIGGDEESVGAMSF